MVMALVTITPLGAQWVLCFASVTRPSRYNVGAYASHLGHLRVGAIVPTNELWGRVVVTSIISLR